VLAESISLSTIVFILMIFAVFLADRPLWSRRSRITLLTTNPTTEIDNRI
jgi:hypothetical protein